MLILKRNFVMVFFIVSVFSLFLATEVNSQPSPNAQSNTSNVGTLKGNFQVTPTGQAHYSIPIEVSPGTAGITPAISIVYDSSASNIRNGLLGMGFSLEGLTAITRCPSNKTQNGLIHGVDFSDQDQFCLNGEQLVAIKGKAGQDRTEYQTYIDSKTKIISYGRQGNGPASFKVWTKGGQVAEYGLTADSQIKAQGKDSVAVWSLNKIQDTSGNYLEIHYFKDESKGTYYPTEINYTGNEKAKLLPYNSIKFIYEDRPDTKVTYQAGSQNTLDKRLKTIQTYQSSALVYEYRFAYEVIDKNIFRSRMASIEKCTGNGICLSPTKFEWQTNEEGWESIPLYTPPTITTSYTSSRFVDLNGDGLLDIVKNTLPHYDATPDQSAWINNGNGWTSAPQYIPPSTIIFDSTDVGSRFVDLNGDGLLDIIQNSGYCRGFAGAWINNGNSWENVPKYTPPMIIIGGSGDDLGSRFIDLDGDGLLDIVQRGGNDFVGAWINKEGSWKNTPQYNPPAMIMSPFEYHTRADQGLRFVDLNGDGLLDIVQKLGYAPYSFQQGAWINNGDSWKNMPQFNPPFKITDSSGHDLGSYFVDLNGDGLLDVLGLGNDRDVWINTGDSWKSTNQYTPPTNENLGLSFVDLNGDGLLDILQNSRDFDSGEMKGAWINNGNSWKSTPQYIPPSRITIVTHKCDDNYCSRRSPRNHDLGLRFVDLNGDGLLDIIQKSGDEFVGAWLNRAKKLPDYLISITDGLGSKLVIDYEPLSGTKVKVYTKEHDAKYPNMDWQGPMYVVYQTSSNAAINDIEIANNSLNHTTTYHYTGAKFNHLGLGFLGFHQVTTTDKSTGISTTTTHSQDTDENNKKHNKGMPVASVTRLANGTVISSSEDSWGLKTYGSGNLNETYYSPYVETSVKNSYDLSGTLLSVTTIKNKMDEYGNPLEIISTVYEPATNKSYTTKTENIYHNDPDRWFLGELLSARVTKSATGAISKIRTSSFVYDKDTSLLMETVAEPHDPKLALATKYERDNFGNIVTTTVSGKGIEDRVSKVKYDDYGRFVIESTNPLNQKTSQKTDPKFGVVLEAADLNGLKTYSEYDGFGRLVLQVTPDGTKTQTTYEWVKVSDLPVGEIQKALKNTAYRITIHTDNSTTNREYFDVLNRKIATTTQGIDGKTIWNLVYYDELGRISQKTLPFFEVDPIYYTKIYYDVLGRVTSSILPDGNTARIEYDGFITTNINQLKQIRKKEVNAIGELVKTTDNLGSETTFKYDAYGNLTVTTDSAGNHSFVNYDALGRKRSIQDPDKGRWTYEYDVLGNLLKQTDAKGQATTFEYDKLNRMISRTDSAGTSTWEYDTAPNGVGKLAKVTSLDLTGKNAQEQLEAKTRAFNAGLKDTVKTYIYDQFGRGIEVRTLLNNETYLNQYSYDKNSRLDIETYPNGLKVKNFYTDLGYLVRITGAGNDAGKIYWQLNSKDAAGRVTSETHSNGLITNHIYDLKTGFLLEISTELEFGTSVLQELLPSMVGVTQAKNIKDKVNQRSGEAEINALGQDIDVANSKVQDEVYIYEDPIGMISGHIDNVNNVNENFQYDKLNRLTGINSSDQDAIALKYDALGNITYKSDVGSYSYGEQNAGPHAVTSINGDKANRFIYDRNGDQIEGVLNGITRKIDYTSYSKPAKIKIYKSTDPNIVNSKAPDASVEFYYNADREKITRVDSTPSKTATTYYLGNYELVTIDNKNGPTIVQQKAYIGPNTIQIETKDTQNSSNNKTEVYELLRNHIGSVTDITDVGGNVVQHFSYTPFGEQKVTKQKEGLNLYHPITYKGFTGHEQVEIEGLNLIHMDGRIYDPVIGRFLSADPFIQDPANSQSLNRYSYCINNPLTLIDPSGFGFFGSLFRSIGRFFSSPVGRIITGVVVGIALGPVGFGTLGVWGAAAAGAGVTMGLGVATGAGWKQILYEGAMTFGITAAVSLKVEELTKLGASGIAGGSSILAGFGGNAIKPAGKNSENKPKDPGEDFPDPSLKRSTDIASPETENSLDESVSRASDRNFSPVGSTESSAMGNGNNHNGAKNDAYAKMFSRTDTVTGKEKLKSFRIGALQVDTYLSTTIHEGNSNIEKVVEARYKYPLSIVNKEGIINVATGVDGSVTHGWSRLSWGSTADNKYIVDVSTPDIFKPGSGTSIGMTIYYDPTNYRNKAKYINDAFGDSFIKSSQSFPLLPPINPIPIIP